MGTGTATIFVDMNRTVPDFGGSWGGEVKETACQSSGEFVHIQPCDSYWDLGTVFTTLTLTQNGDSVSGSFRFGP